MDVFFTTLSPSIAQISLMGILLAFLGGWMITFLMLALRSTSQQPVDTQQERVHREKIPQEDEDAKEVAQIAS